MAGQFKDTWLINIYAPSGAENRKEREKFFTHDLAYLLPSGQKDIVLAGDFNLSSLLPTAQARQI